MSPEIIRGWHALSALGLQFTDEDSVSILTGNEQPFFRQRDKRAGRFIRLLISIFYTINFKFRAAKFRRGNRPVSAQSGAAICARRAMSSSEVSSG